MSRAAPRHVVPGRNPVLEALRAGRALHEVLLAGDDAELEALAAAGGVRVRRAGRDELDRLSQGVRHQGVLATAPPFAHVALDDLAGADLVLVLDGITDPRNLGAIARVAEQAGAGGLVVRERRGVGVGPAAEKAAAGALSWLPVAQVTNLTRAVAALADAGLWSVALDGDADGTVWDEPLLDGRVALVVGAEGAGVSRLLRDSVDARARIPMGGHLDSLNAATAAAVAAFEWRRRRHPAPPSRAG